MCVSASREARSTGDNEKVELKQMQAALGGLQNILHNTSHQCFGYVTGGTPIGISRLH